jgi:hypothetical protein
MDRQARAQLLLEREDTEREIMRIQNELKQAAEVFLFLGQKLKDWPDDVVFSNAPNSLGSVPIDYIHKQSLDWNTIPDMRHIAQLIQDLRTKKSQLSGIKQQLG